MNSNKPIIFLTGQNGMLGCHITQSLADDYHLHGLTRTNQSTDNPSWNYRQSLQQLNISAPHAVIHLAGAGIADKRWSEKYKQTIYNSRINGTQWLCDEILTQEALPEAFLCASAIGYYGHRPAEILTEASSPGDNYVAQISTHWEQATNKLVAKNIRTVNMRFGMILSRHGGALKDMLLPYKLGLGGKLGDGNQIYSWVDIDDASDAINHLLNNTNIQGAINITSPHALSNKQFTQTLAKVLKRPAFMHMPAAVVRLVFGEVADELLLADAHVTPARLLKNGFEFQYPKLQQSLQKILK